MSTPAEEITLDMDALDAEVAKGKSNGAVAHDTDAITVEKTDETPPAAAKSGVTPEEGIDKLKKQLDDERARRIAAENAARESAEAEADARGTAQTSQLDLIKGAISQVTQANDSLEARYAEAAAAGDWNAAAKVQREMAGNAAKLLQLENGKTALEKAPKPTPRAAVDKVEQFAAQLSPQSGAWVRAHPEFVNDPHKNRQMLAAHELAMARGLKVDTPEYFGSIEKTLDLAAPVMRADPIEEDPSSAAAKPVNGGRSAAPAAPVSRSGNGANGNRPNIVRLSPAEVEIAGNMGMTPEEYARNKIALKKEGKLS